MMFTLALGKTTSQGWTIMMFTLSAGINCIYWPAALTKTNRENKNVKYNVLKYSFYVALMQQYLKSCPIGTERWIISIRGLTYQFAFTALYWQLMSNMWSMQTYKQTAEALIIKCNIFLWVKRNVCMLLHKSILFLWSFSMIYIPIAKIMK
jgi:hypothetical protein